MVVVDFEVPEKVYKKIDKKGKLTYKDIINYYEETSFEYEKVSMKAGDFKSYLIKELSNG